jgi:hypothetical protein
LPPCQPPSQKSREKALYLPSAKQNLSLRRFLESQIQRSRGNDSFVLPEELFGAFQTASLDVNGATCSGYSDKGHGVEAEAAVDLTALSVFPVPGVTCEVSAGAGGARASRSMLVMRRMPRHLAGYATGPSLGFFQFEGKRWQASAKVGVEFAISPPSLIQDALKKSSGAEAEYTGQGEDDPATLSLELEVSAQMTAGAKAEYLWASAKAPSFYESSMDSGLQKQFVELMPEWRREEVKEEAARFLIMVSQNVRSDGWTVAPEKRAAIPGVRSAYSSEELLTQLGNVVAGPYSQRAQYLKTRLQAFQKTEKAALKQHARNWLTTLGVQPPDSLTGNVSSEEWQTAINHALLRISANTPNGRAWHESGSELINRLKLFSQSTPDQTAVSARQGLAYFSLFSLGGEVAVGVEAMAKLRGKATAGAEVGGRLSRSQFRFQCFAELARHSNSPLIQTQDVCLVYKQVEAAASLQVKLPKFEREAGFSKTVFNAMQWSASIAQWIYPGRADVVALHPGSGYSLGVSVVYSRLTDSAARGTRSRYLARIAARLGVSMDTLAAFLRETPLFSDRIELPNDVLLLEASFATGRDANARVSATTPHFSLDSLIQKQMSQWFAEGRLRLQSITARYRSADMADNSKVRAFQLGFRGVAKVGIQLRAVEEAGTDSIIDLHRWWADPAFAHASNDPAGMYEQAVPPVALFHQ